VRKITDDDKERRCVVASDEEEKNKSEEQYLLVVAWFSGGGAALITGEGGANSLTMMRKKIDCDGRPGSFYFKMSHLFFMVGCVGPEGPWRGTMSSSFYLWRLVF
jgi:hypothetical protein